MKKAALLTGLLAIAGCGGGGGGELSGTGGVVSGFYSLSASVTTQDITSYAVAVDQNGNISLPVDNIRVSLDSGQSFRGQSVAEELSGSTTSFWRSCTECERQLHKRSKVSGA